MDLATLLSPFLLKRERPLGSKRTYYSLGSLTREKKFLKKEKAKGSLSERATASHFNNKFSFPVGLFFSEKKRVKGQMFFIAAIFMIIGVVLLRGVLLLPVISQEKAFQETSYLDRNLDNIQREYEYVSGIASVKPNASLYGADYIYNLSNFIRSDFDSRQVYVLIVANGTDQSFFVTVGNFMQGNVTGTISFTDSAPPSVSFSLMDKKNSTYSFAGSSAWINATLNYTLNGGQTVEKFYFNDSPKNYIAGFFDVELRGNGMLVRSKNYYNRTW